MAVIVGPRSAGKGAGFLGSFAFVYLLTVSACLMPNNQPYDTCEGYDCEEGDPNNTIGNGSTNSTPKTPDGINPFTNPIVDPDNSENDDTTGLDGDTSQMPSEETPKIVSDSPIKIEIGAVSVAKIPLDNTNMTGFVYALATPLSDATIDPKTGRLNWAPGVEYIGEHTIKVVVANPNLKDANGKAVQTEAFLTIIVAQPELGDDPLGGGGIVVEDNHPPILRPIGSRQATELELLTFNISATDEESDDILYETLELPEGAEFDPETATFKWTPTEDDEGLYQVTFIARDPADERLQSTKTATITVLDNPNIRESYLSKTLVLPVWKRKANFDSELIIVNPDGSKSANVAVTYYQNKNNTDLTGEVVKEDNFTIAPNGQLVIENKTTEGIPDAFSGLAQIIANAPLAAVANVARVDDYQGGLYDTNDSFSYPAYTTKSKRLYIPLLEKRRDNYISGINIVNLGDEPTNITSIFYSETSGVAMYEGSGTIGPNGKMSLSAEAFPIEDGIRFSGVIRSSKSAIAAYVYSDANVYTGTDGGLRAFGTTGQPSWSKKLFIPAVYRNANGYVTTLAIQNAGFEPTKIVVEYYDGTSATPIKSITSPEIQKNAAWYIVTNTNALAPAEGFKGYAIISNDNDQFLVAHVFANKDHINQAANPPNDGIGLGYVAQNSASKEIRLPSVYRAYNNGYNTCIRVINVNGGSGSTVSIDFFKNDGSKVGAASIAGEAIGGMNYREFCLTDIAALGNNFIGSAQITATSEIAATALSPSEPEMRGLAHYSSGQ